MSWTNNIDFQVRCLRFEEKGGKYPILQFKAFKWLQIDQGTMQKDVSTLVL